MNGKGEKVTVVKIDLTKVYLLIIADTFISLIVGVVIGKLT